MNIVDLIIILLVIATIVRGFEIGFVRQTGSLLGLIIGLAAGSWLITLLDGGTIVNVLILVFSVVGGVALGEFGGIYLKRVIRWNSIHRLDQILGGAMGALTCLALVWFGSAIIAGVPGTELQRGIRDSKIIIWLDANLPPVSDVATHLNDLFIGVELPGIQNPGSEPSFNTADAALPSLDDFARISAQTSASVMRIEGRSCQGLGTGSGFVIRPGILVSNAHVVAGMPRPYIEDKDGNRYRAEIIGFDPELDIAVLHTDSSLDAALPLEEGLVQPGTQGIVQGYPGGGSFTTLPAVVMERFTALGRDIYDERSTARDVYALKASVRGGNSGGPLIDKNGTVIGVIFARSLSSDDVGYALTMPEVLEVIDSSLASPSAAGSERCG